MTNEQGRGHERERPRRATQPAIDPQRLLSWFLIIAVVLAPPLALLYGRLTGLAMLVAALLLTSLLARSSLPGIDPAYRGRVRTLIGINLVLVGVAVVAFIVTLVR